MHIAADQLLPMSRTLMLLHLWSHSVSERKLLIMISTAMPCGVHAYQMLDDVRLAHTAGM